MDLNSLENLRKQIPIIDDKLIISLANHINVNKNIASYKKSRKFFSRFIDNLTGKERKRTELIDENNAYIHEELFNIIASVSEKINITQSSLIYTNNILFEVKNKVEKQQTFINKIDNILTEHNQKIIELQNNFNDEKEFNKILDKWRAETIYSELPVILQIIFLSFHVFSKITNIEYKERFVNNVIAQFEYQKHTHFPISELFKDCISEIDTKYKDKGIEFIADLLVLPEKFEFPILKTLSSSFDYASLPNGMLKPVESAIAIHEQSNYFYKTYSFRTLIEQITNETYELTQKLRLKI